MSDDVYSDCPDCGSGNTVPHVYGNTSMDAIMEVYYPRARDCKVCGALWDESLRESQVRFRHLMLALVKKAQP